MKTAFWTYVVGQGLLVGAALIGKMSIWAALIPTFILVGLSAGTILCMLIFEFMFNSMDNCGPLGWDDKDDDEDDEDDKKDSE